MLFTGELKRHRRTEQILPRMVKKRKLVSRRWGKKLAYAVPRLKNTSLEHGLGCTETLIRIWLSDKTGTILPERYFRHLGSIPDWGIRYGSVLLLCEFSTKSNFEGARIIKTKMTKYLQNMEKIKKKFNSSNIIVIFVLDVPKERIQNFIKRNPWDGPFFFTDYETFKDVPLGQQLFRIDIFLGRWAGRPNS